MAALLHKEPVDAEDVDGKLHALFRELDVDGDRLLDLAELSAYMLSHGYADQAAAERAALALLQSQPSHQIGLTGLSYMEFEGAHARGQLGPDAVAIRTAFDAFDPEKRGFIELIEIKAVLSDEAAQTIGDLVQRVDPHHDGQIAFAVFSAAMTSTNVQEAASECGGRLRGFLTTSSSGHSSMSYVSADGDSAEEAHARRLAAANASSNASKNSGSPVHVLQ